MASKGRGSKSSGNRGGSAQTLRNYWTTGAGAAKIRWGTPGDYNRCVRAVSKYLGSRARGYCALRHQAATGMWTSQHARALRGGGRRRR
ncbi:hypothetical protein Sliba_04810 [Streptomyces nigrescens]|uniref:Uncharacterized protein n=1 Tax=Streptomyces nigrescens TaxID=1920 RepID=A0A640T9M4_STRNI|nr:hypothetical protein Sliba_04810 [Streptomyces libani subsp. libani]GGV85608.1 hypothetical protein GCM10010500_02340 [Streptomyces libani subsp. libani]